MKFFTALATAAILVTGVTVASPAQASSCSGLSLEAEKACWKQVLEGNGEIVTKAQAAINWDGCPAGQAMARVAGEQVGCMTPAQYKLYEAQMRAAYRRPAPVGGYVPNNALLQQQIVNNRLYNQHQQFRIRNGY